MKKHYLSLTQTGCLPLLWTLLALSQPTWAQSIPDAQWARVGRTLTITNDGNIVTGESIFIPNNPGFPGQRGDRLVKYSLRGDQIWSTGLLKGGFFLGGKIPGFDFESIGRITASAASADGGVTVAGPLNLRGGTNVSVKVNKDGGVGSWQETDIFFSSFTTDVPGDMVTTPDGGFILLSLATATQPNTPSTVALRRYNSGKQLVWTKQIAYPGSASPNGGVTKGNAIINTPDGGFLIVGLYNPFGLDGKNSGASQGWMAKLDAAGNVSWQKLISAPGPNYSKQLSIIMDAIVSADGAGYALVGHINFDATLLVEIDFNGNVRSRTTEAITLNITNAHITLYTGSGGKKYYAVGNTTYQSGRSDPQLHLLDPTNLSVVANRTFPGPGASSLTGIATAGDGSLVFVTDNNQLVKLQPEAITQPPTGPLTLTAPTYNCATGAFTFNTSGGNGSPIEYMAPGITGWTTNPNQFVDEGSRTALDVQPFTLMARQNGVTVSLVWDLRAFCNGGPPQPPQPPQPPVGALALTTPAYNCTTGAFTFNTSGGNGSTIEYMAPGITGWTTNPNQFVDEGSRTALDVQPFNLTARQNGVTVTLLWDLRAFCNGGPPPPPPPPPGALALTTPTYNCATGAFTFNTSGGNGSPIEYMAPGITGWTTNPNQFVDEGSRTANDVQPFTLMARQNGVTVTLVWNLKAACGRARTAALPEPGTQLRVRVLGNPVLNQTAEVDITGAEHQALQLNLVDLQGRVLHQQCIEQAEALQRVQVPVGAGSGVLLLNVSTSTKRQQVKLIKH